MVFQPKNKQELHGQLTSAQERLGSSLPPPHADLDVLRADIKELKAAYPKRYEFYLDQLRREKNGGRLGEEEARRTRNWLEAMNALDGYIYNHHQEIEDTLTPEQITVFEAIRGFFEQGGSRGYVKLPTGSGKTVLFIEMIEAMKLKTLIVVPRNILLKQTAERIEEFAEDLDVGRVFSKAKEYGSQVTLITYDSLVAGVSKGTIDPKDFDLVVLDEVHRGLSNKRKETIGKFGHALQVGFTATPDFSEKKKTEHILPTCIFEMSVREAVERGMLCSFVSGVIQTNVDLSKVKLKDNGEYDEHELEMAVDIESRNRAAVNTYKEAAPDDKAVVYCAGINHAKHVAERYRKEGVVAAAVWGRMPKNEMKAALEGFASGKIKVLCNADLLIEGFDDKEVRLCINLRPTRSLVVSEQRGGRVLRNDPKNPDKVAIIVDFLDRHGSTGLAGSILFAEVAGESMIEPRKKGSRTRSDGKEPVDKDPNEMGAAGIPSGLLDRLKAINLDGMEVTFEVEEIVKIVSEKRDGLDRRKKSFLPFDEFIREAKEAGIKSSNHYPEVRKNHPNWPAKPHVAYEGEWKGWGIVTQNIFDTEKKFLPFDDFIREARELGVTSANYKEIRKDHPLWPSSPHKTYKGQWKGWDLITQYTALFKGRIPSFEDFVRETKAAGVKSIVQYTQLRSQYPNWPSEPDRVYKDKWTEWGVITGNVSKIKLRSVDGIPASLAKSDFETAATKISNVALKDLSVANKEGIFKSGGKLWGSFDAIRDLLKGLPPSTAKILLEHPDVPKRMGKTADGESRIFYSIQDAKQRYYDKAGRDFPAHDPKK